MPLVRIRSANHGSGADFTLCYELFQFSLVYRPDLTASIFIIPRHFKLLLLPQMHLGVH
jgi:hypothetical protein